MTLVAAVFVPTGIVLSADSRTVTTMTMETTDPRTPSQQRTQTQFVTSDAAHKLFVHGRIGVGIFGEALIHNLPIAHYMARFASETGMEPEVGVREFAQELLGFFQGIQSGLALGFLVAGYDNTEPWVMTVDVRGAAVLRVNHNGTQPVYGVVRGGDTAVVDRLLSQDAFNPQFPFMHLQDAVDFSRHLIRTTIDQLRFEPRFPTVGGPIDTLVISTERAFFLAQKALQAP